MNYYNENDARAAAWLRELIQDGHIPRGHVDERSILELKPSDLAGYAQCHFFAGIGGWPLALRLAGWPDAEPVWTGSCPCQPFSCAGKGMGESDARHLWPYFRNLIGHCRPAKVFGEQVASPAGRAWLAGIRADLERAAYAVGSANLCAAAVGAPHQRRRLFWLADTQHAIGRSQFETETARGRRPGPGGSGDVERMVQSNGSGQRKGKSASKIAGHRSPVEPAGGALWMGSPIQPGLEGHSGNGDERHKPGRQRTHAPGPVAAAGNTGGRLGDADGEQADASKPGQSMPGEGLLRCGFWSDSYWHLCRDGKSRRIPLEPAFQPLAPRLPGRVGLLRGAGNAIVPEIAAQFILASIEACG